MVRAALLFLFLAHVFSATGQKPVLIWPFRTKSRSWRKAPERHSWCTGPWNSKPEATVDTLPLTIMEVRKTRKIYVSRQHRGLTTFGRGYYYYIPLFLSIPWLGSSPFTNSRRLLDRMKSASQPCWTWSGRSVAGPSEVDVWICPASQQSIIRACAWYLGLYTSPIPPKHSCSPPKGTF